MMDIKEIEKRAKSFAKGREKIIASYYILSIVVFPLVESIGVSYYSDLSKTIGEGFLLSICLSIVFIHLFVGYFAYQTSTHEAFFFDFLEIERELEKERSKSDKLLYLFKESEYELESSVASVKSSLDFISKYNGENITVEKVKEGVKDALALPIDKRSQVFGFESESKHSFAVYLYDEDGDILNCLYRNADDRISTDNRSWEPGQGHIGMCFQRNATIISPDVLEAPLLEYSLDESDKRNYRSMASTPIVIYEDSENDQEPFKVKGVFIVTSSQPGQLSRGRHESTMLILGATLSILFSAVDWSDTDDGAPLPE